MTSPNRAEQWRAVAAQKVQREAPDRMFGDIQCEVHPQQVTEDVEILQKPGFEVECLMDPHIAGLDGGEATEIGLVIEVSGVSCIGCLGQCAHERRQ